MTQVSIPAKSTAWLRQKSETKQGHENRLCAVSTEDQNHDLQLAALKNFGCEHIFIEKATGAHVKRMELTSCLKTLAAGDTLMVWKLNRLGSSLTEAIDTATPTGRAMWQMIGILAESLWLFRPRGLSAAAFAEVKK